jgi:hypothetical protein
MQYAPPNIQGTAGGSIVPSRIVCSSTTADNTFLQSALSTSPNFGVAQQGTRRAPGTGDDDGNAAIAGETIQIYGPGCVAPVEASGAITQGDFVTADINGRAITTTSAGDTVVGMALQAATALGDIIAILVMVFRYR